MKTKIKETDLYLPIKSFLENQGYQVKGEIIDCDIVAQKNTSDPLDDPELLIIELKLSLNITLLLQAIDRFSITDLVYIAIPKQCSIYKKKKKEVKKLIARLGFGLIVVDLVNTQKYVEVICDPKDYKPRKNKKKQNTLIKEFVTRDGDPQKGGSTRKKSGLTAYRQRCIRVAEYLSDKESAKGSEINKAIDEPQATVMLNNNYYGWFTKIERGIYSLSDKGLSEFQ